ncbi:hypothetical protein [Labrenzia sp. VG12]|uniref:hypothetical protein n=1 Tax=Labrenzia sp. VG12 TaxID=2021862 RepID=UPI000B8BF418|nr:hypothetical protein [Labrenzia sp. VG12]ASP34593.1 hypothetical protein CHH27_16220 [Labrenzia sp. VG12]
MADARPEFAARSPQGIGDDPEIRLGKALARRISTGFVVQIAAVENGPAGKELRKKRAGKSCELANLSRGIFVSFELVNSTPLFRVS